MSKAARAGPSARMYEVGSNPHSERAQGKGRAMSGGSVRTLRQRKRTALEVRAGCDNDGAAEWEDDAPGGVVVEGSADAVGATDVWTSVVSPSARMRKW